MVGRRAKCVEIFAVLALVGCRYDGLDVLTAMGYGVRIKADLFPFLPQ